MTDELDAPKTLSTKLGATKACGPQHLFQARQLPETYSNGNAVGSCLVVDGPHSTEPFQEQAGQRKELNDDEWMDGRRDVVLYSDRCTGGGPAGRRN